MAMYRHKSFPLSMVATGRHLLLVGGGEGGADRLDTALKFDWEKITFVGVDITTRTRELAADERVTLLEREIQESDIDGVDLVIESTFSNELGEKLARWCRPRRIPLNAMDKLENCDVYYSALIMRGPLVISINSSGDAPALTSTLRKLLEKKIGPGWCNAGMLMAEARNSLPRGTARMEMLKELANDPGMLECIGDNNIDGMQKRIQDAICRMPD